MTRKTLSHLREIQLRLAWHFPLVQINAPALQKVTLVTDDEFEWSDADEFKTLVACFPDVSLVIKCISPSWFKELFADIRPNVEFVEWGAFCDPPELLDKRGIENKTLCHIFF